MKTNLQRKWLEFDSSIFYEKLAKWILSILILVILSGMLGGVVITMFHLRLLFSLDIEHALRVIIIDALTILALLEIFKTTMAYFSEGRIKVTYIIAPFPERFQQNPYFKRVSTNSK